MEEIYSERILNCIYTVMKKSKILYKQQLVKVIMRMFNGLSSQDANKYIFKSQLNNVLFTSPDGYCIERDTYFTRTNDKYMNHVNRVRSISMDTNMADILSLKDKSYIDTFWIVAEMMPEAIDYIVCEVPWLYLFIVPERNKRFSYTYEVTKINKGEEISECTLLNNYKQNIDSTYAQMFRRVAIIDDEVALDYLPDNMFAFVFMLSNDSKNHLRIVKNWIK